MREEQVEDEDSRIRYTGLVSNQQALNLSTQNVNTKNVDEPMQN